ncbi:hypothetical protein ACTMU2_37265 [Cupriavidus basilensis]
MAVLALALETVPNGALLGLECYRPVALLSVIAATVLLLGASWAASTGSPEPAMISIISVSGLQVAAKSWIVIRKIGWEAISTWRTVNRSDLMKVCSFAGPMLLVSLLSSSGAWVLGQMILNGPGGPAAFARYAIGLQWFSLGLFLPAILSDVVLPRIIRASKEGFSAKELTKTSAGAAVLMASLISIGAISSWRADSAPVWRALRERSLAHCGLSRCGHHPRAQRTPSAMRSWQTTDSAYGLR